jgi:hypothetical protein
MPHPVLEIITIATLELEVIVELQTRISNKVMISGDHRIILHCSM